MGVNIEEVKARYFELMEIDSNDSVELAKKLRHFFDDGMLSYLMGIAMAVESKQEDKLDLDETIYPMSFPSEDSMFWSKKKFNFEYQGDEYTFELASEDVSGEGDEEEPEITHFISGKRISDAGHNHIAVVIIPSDSEFEAMFGFAKQITPDHVPAGDATVISNNEVLWETLPQDDLTDFLAMLYSTANRALG